MFFRNLFGGFVSLGGFDLVVQFGRDFVFEFGRVGGVEVLSVIFSFVVFNREEIFLLDRVFQVVFSGGIQGFGCGVFLLVFGVLGRFVGFLFRMECGLVSGKCLFCVGVLFVYRMWKLVERF